MMGVKAFASQGSVWHCAVPALEHFTRWVNSNERRYGVAVDRYGPQERSAFIAETAFEAVATKTGPTTSVQAAAFDMLDPLPRGWGSSKSLNAMEERETFELIANLHRFLEAAESPTNYRPLIPGCGVVPTSAADVLAGTNLIEVKSVQRGFRGSDLRQVLTYGALAYASDISIATITLLNPRRAVYFSSPVQELALDIGAGSWVQLMQDLVEAMSGYDVSN